METVLVILDMISRLGVLVARLIADSPDSQRLRAEAERRLEDLRAIVLADPLAAELQAELDKAVPR